jgi:hypothetical protein
VLHARTIQLDGLGAGTRSVPPARLAALEGGTLTNRGHTFNPGDRLQPAEEFVSGPLVASGDPDALVTLWLRYGS